MAGIWATGVNVSVMVTVSVRVLNWFLIFVKASETVIESVRVLRLHNVLDTVSPDVTVSVRVR